MGIFNHYMNDMKQLTLVSVRVTLYLFAGKTRICTGIAGLLACFIGYTELRAHLDNEGGGDYIYCS